MPWTVKSHQKRSQLQPLGKDLTAQDIETDTSDCAGHGGARKPMTTVLPPRPELTLESLSRHGLFDKIGSPMDLHDVK